MAFEDCPVLASAAPYWYYWCTFRFHRIAIIVVAIPYMIVNIGEFFDLFLTTHSSMLDAILKSYLTVQLSCGVIRSWAIVYKMTDLKSLLEEVDEEYTEISKVLDSKIQRFARRLIFILRMLCRINFAVGLASVISYNIRPMLTKVRDHPYPVYIPYIDFRDTPYFQIIYVLTTYVSYTGYISYCAVINIYLSLISFGIIRIRVLQHYLRNLSSPPGREEEKLHKCVKNHIKIKDFVSKINDIYSSLALYEFICFSLLLCSLLFMMATSGTMTEKLLLCSYILMNLSQSFQLYYFANMLRDESILLNYAAYEAPWYMYHNKLQKQIWFFTIGSTRPLEIMIGNIHPMSLQTFQSILNGSYSYFNLLRSGETSN